MGTAIGIFSSTGKISSVNDLLIKYVNGLRLLYTHFLATKVGISSHPALEFFSEDMTRSTSKQDIYLTMKILS